MKILPILRILSSHILAVWVLACGPPQCKTQINACCGSGPVTGWKRRGGEGRMRPWTFGRLPLSFGWHSGLAPGSRTAASAAISRGSCRSCPIRFTGCILKSTFLAGEMPALVGERRNCPLTGEVPVHVAGGGVSPRSKTPQSACADSSPVRGAFPGTSPMQGRTAVLDGKMVFALYSRTCTHG